MTEHATQDRKRLTLILPAEVHKGLKVAAAQDEKTIIEIIEELVKAFLEKRGKKGDKK